MWTTTVMEYILYIRTVNHFTWRLQNHCQESGGAMWSDLAIWSSIVRKERKWNRADDVWLKSIIPTQSSFSMRDKFSILCIVYIYYNTCMCKAKWMYVRSLLGDADTQNNYTHNLRHKPISPYLLRFSHFINFFLFCDWSSKRYKFNCTSSLGLYSLRKEQKKQCNYQMQRKWKHVQNTDTKKNLNERSKPPIVHSSSLLAHGRLGFRWHNSIKLIKMFLNEPFV